MKFKTFIALLICISIALAALPAVSLASEPACYAIDYVNSEVIGGSIIAEVSVTGSGDAAVIAAAYKDGALVSMSAEEVSLTDGETQIVSFELAGDESCAVKAFVWDSLAGMRSLSEAVEGSEPTIWREEVIVTDSFLTRAAWGSRYDPEDDLITLVAAKDLYYNNKGYRKGEEIGQFHGDAEAALLIGQTCTAELQGKKILSISPVKGMNKTTTIFSDRLTLWDDLEYFDYYEGTNKYMEANENGTVFYWENLSDMRPKAMVPDENARIFVNYVDETGVFTEGTDIEAATYGTGVVDFIDNDNDGDFDFALCRRYEMEGVVGRVGVENGVCSFKGKVGAERVPDIDDLADDRSIQLFIRDGALSDSSEVTVGDSITTMGNKYESGLIIYYVSSESFEGRNAVYDMEENTLKVDGKIYSLSSMMRQKARDLAGISGVFYLNADGRLSLGEPDILGQYGYVLSLEKETKWNRTTAYKVTLMDAGGKVQTYDINTMGKLYNDTAACGHLAFDEEIYAALERAIRAYYGRLIKYVLEDGKITTVALRDYMYLANMDVDGSYDAVTRCVGRSYPFADNAVIFTVETDSDGKYGYDDPALVHAVKGSGLEAGAFYDLHVYSERGATTAAIRLIKDEIKFDKSQNIFIVREYKLYDDSEGNNIVELSGLQGGDRRTYRLRDGAVDVFMENGDPSPGTALLVGPEIGGYVNEIELLALVTDDDEITSMAHIDTDGNKDILCGMAYLDEQDGTYVNNGYILVSGYYPIGDRGYRPANATKITMVDLTRSEVTVRADSTDSLDVPAYKYRFLVLFRAYDVDDINSWDLQDNRTQVRDLVFYKVFNF